MMISNASRWNDPMTGSRRREICIVLRKVIPYYFDGHIHEYQQNYLFFSYGDKNRSKGCTLDLKVKIKRE